MLPPPEDDDEDNDDDDDDGYEDNYEEYIPTFKPDPAPARPTSTSRRAPPPCPSRDAPALLRLLRLRRLRGQLRRVPDLRGGLRALLHAPARPAPALAPPRRPPARRVVRVARGLGDVGNARGVARRRVGGRARGGGVCERDGDGPALALVLVLHRIAHLRAPAPAHRFWGRAPRAPALLPIVEAAAYAAKPLPPPPPSPKKEEKRGRKFFSGLIPRPTELVRGPRDSVSKTQRGSVASFRSA
ncbi:hypothetical protein B0H17DRAFT_1065414, partial [Mycena rosella]